MGSTLGSILGILLTGAVGIFAYAWQERVKRNTSLAERRKGLYEILLPCIFGIIAAKSGSDRSAMISEIEKCWLFASDDVLNACYEYMKIYNYYYTKGDGNVLKLVKKDTRVRKKFEERLAEIFLAMRRDIKGIRSTSLSEEWAESHVKIFDWGIIEK